MRRNFPMPGDPPKVQPPRYKIVHHSAESIDPMVTLLPGIQGRAGWYVRDQRGCLLRIHGPYATREPLRPRSPKSLGKPFPRSARCLS